MASDAEKAKIKAAAKVRAAEQEKAVPVQDAGGDDRAAGVLQERGGRQGLQRHNRVHA